MRAEKNAYLSPHLSNKKLQEDGLGGYEEVG